MAINLGNGSLLEGGGTALKVRNSSGTKVFDQGVSTYGSATFGYNSSTSVPMFVAGRSTDSGWISVADGGWRKVNNYCTDVSVNVDSCYDTSATRFNVPLTGPYFLMFTAYTYAGNYYHPTFGVNGAPSTRHGSETKYRIRGHGYVSGYQTDAQMEEVIWLQAGDYVEVFFATSSTGYHYAPYSLFAGVYVG